MQLELSPQEKKLVRLILTYNQQYLLNNETSSKLGLVYRSGWTVLVPLNKEYIKFSTVISSSESNKEAYLENVSSEHIPIRDDRCKLIMNITRHLQRLSTKIWITDTEINYPVNEYCGIISPQAQLVSFNYVPKEFQTQENFNKFNKYIAVLFVLKYSSPIEFMRGMSFKSNIQ